MQTFAERVRRTRSHGKRNVRFEFSDDVHSALQHMLAMSISSSSCLLPARKHNDKKPSCLHLRVFAPKDLSQSTRGLSHYCFAYAHSSTVNDSVFTTVLIRRREHVCTVDAWGSCQDAQQGSRIRLSEQLPSAARLHYPSEETENCFQQLEAYANLCSTYQLIYYHPAAEGFAQNVANTSASALSAVLKKIDEQQVDVKSCSMLTAFFTATLELQQSQPPDTANHGGTHFLVLLWCLLGNRLIAHDCQVKQD